MICKCVFKISKITSYEKKKQIVYFQYFELIYLNPFSILFSTACFQSVCKTFSFFFCSFYSDDFKLSISMFCTRVYTCYIACSMKN